MRAVSLSARTFVCGMSTSSPTASRGRGGGDPRGTASNTTPPRSTASRTAGGGGAGAATTALAPSPHYTTSLRSRHSLYGTEDRVVLDIGSSIIKAGFSGEPAPRECRRTTGTDADGEVWGLEKSEPTEEEWLVREHRLRRIIRSIWFERVCSGGGCHFCSRSFLLTCAPPFRFIKLQKSTDRPANTQDHCRRESASVDADQGNDRPGPVRQSAGERQPSG